jgi:hypothetical protein
VKKIAIGVDNYKIERFKTELAKLGYSDIEVVPFVNNTSLIKVDVPADAEKLHEVHKLCIRLQTDFKNSN